MTSMSAMTQTDLKLWLLDKAFLPVFKDRMIHPWFSEIKDVSDFRVLVHPKAPAVFFAIKDIGKFGPHFQEMNRKFEDAIVLFQAQTQGVLGFIEPPGQIRLMRFLFEGAAEVQALHAHLAKMEPKPPFANGILEALKLLPIAPVASPAPAPGAPRPC